MRVLPLLIGLALSLPTGTLAQFAFPPETFYQALGAKETYAEGQLEVELKNGRLYRIFFQGPWDPKAMGRLLEAATGERGLSPRFEEWAIQNAAHLEGRLSRVLLPAAVLVLDLREKGRVVAQATPLEVEDLGQDRHVLGEKGVYVRIFSDFQCPYCRRLFQEVLPRLKAWAKEGRLRVSYRHFPLFEIHPQAVAAAVASECAAEMGAFWPYHDLLMQNPLGDYLGLAERLGLDQARFSACLESASPKDLVMKDRREAERLGLRGTPTVFVGPFLLPNPYDLALYEAYLELAR